MSRRYRVWTLHKGYLLDTSVLSVLTPGREAFVPAHLPPWLQAQHDKLFIPCITIAELAQGIGKLRRAGVRAADPLPDVAVVVAADVAGVGLRGIWRGSRTPRITPSSASPRPAPRVAGRRLAP